MARGGAAAGAGLAATALGLGLGELTAAFLDPGASPIAGVGGAIIDAAPPGAKDVAIALFGTSDKLALVLLIGALLLVAGAFTGILEQRRPPWGRVVAGAVGVAGAAIALTRPDAGVAAWLPSVVGGGVTVLALGFLIRRERASVTDTPREKDTRALSRGRTDGPTRRSFLLWSVGAAAVGVLALAGSTVVRAGSQAVQSVRNALRLPAPAKTAPPIPPGAQVDVAGMTPVITPNEAFYRIDTALVVPNVNPTDWSLRIHGLVANEVTLTWDQLMALPLEESVTTLMCVSNEVGGDLIGNAVWLGYPVRELLARAVPAADADMVLSRSIDGFTASTPIETLTDDRNAILAVGMNGDPLPLEHGFPVRMVVPGLYGYVSATKWITELEVTRYADASAYWTQRGWAPRGPVKLSSRIDVPRSGQTLAAGNTVVAGVAWQQHVGVSGVEVRVDGGAWQPAQLAPAISDDTWVQWTFPWTASSGQHQIECRAISATGQVQTGTVAPPVPDGATGWDRLSVSVS
ncbi:molybdopterin-dependent oxidoreductase [Microbacterium sp. X-17]|uniref:molybdopterin-dependent oxidoreductase n=1 Tax=Microbacterium sp. X-17 TaxID=3144404 RepID=UPI0031F4C696